METEVGSDISGRADSAGGGGSNRKEFSGKLSQEARDALRDPRKQGQAHRRQVLS